MADKKSLHDAIIAFLAEHLSMEDASGPITRNENPNWDSIKHLTLCFALEDKYSIDLTQEEIVRMDSSEAIADIVRSKKEEGETRL